MKIYSISVAGPWSSKFILCVLAKISGTWFVLIISMQRSFVSLRRGTTLNLPLMWTHACASVFVPVWINYAVPAILPSLPLSQSEQVPLNQWIWITGLNFKDHLFLRGGRSCQSETPSFFSSQRTTLKVISNWGEATHQRVCHPFWFLPMCIRWNMPCQCCLHFWVLFLT